MSEVVLRMRHCRACGAVFCICSHCDRGQRYCSQACRQVTRRRQRRAANRRHQRTELGRRAHRMRQRQYRLRRAGAHVTDHGSHSGHVAAFTRSSRAWQLCRLRPSRPVDRPLSSESAAAKSSKAARSVGKRSKNCVSGCPLTTAAHPVK